MPADEKCIEAMYNYVTVIMNMIENRSEMHVASSIHDFSGSLISANVSSRLVDHWAKEVEGRCGVKIDESMVESIVDEENGMMAPSLIGILRAIGKSESEIRSEMESKKTEVEGMLYG